MNPANIPSSETERRKQVKLRVRPDLSIQPQKYEGRTYYVVKDPVSLRYFRFKEQEYFLLSYFDGKHTMDDAQKTFEKRFRPERLTLEDLEQFGMQLMTVGLAQNESPKAGEQLYEHRRKRKRTELLQAVTNILYIKIPIFDPEKLLRKMLPFLSFLFTSWFLFLSLSFMAGALTLVGTHFELFLSRLPTYQEFFSPKTLIYLWAALGIIKVIHEFGHGLSCKHFGGEVHEMGFLILCLSPAMYCNVSDAWTMPNKWHRIIISFAGIYVELMIAAGATFIWWNTPVGTFVNNMSLSLMIVCSVNTVVFNGNPLMRFDGYYVLADWIEIPNLRDRANRYMQRLGMEYLLGIEVQPEPYMALDRRILFIIFGVISYVYRWVITFVLLRFLATFLRPYKLEVISTMLALFALGSMMGWPLYRLITNVNKRGRLPDMKAKNISFTATAFVALVLAFFFLPLPIFSRVRQLGLVQVQPQVLDSVPVAEPGYLKKVLVHEGELVQKGRILAEFASLELENRLESIKAEKYKKENMVKVYDAQIPLIRDDKQRQSVREDRAKAEGERMAAAMQLAEMQRSVARLTLRAPRDGVVMGLPQPDEVGKYWDRDAAMPFCSIGDPGKLRVLVPVPPIDYDLVRDNLKLLGGRRQLAVTVRVQGLAEHTWPGHVEHLPESEAKTIPVALSSKGGGPLAVKPGGDPKELVPQSQVYLLGVDIDNPAPSVVPGTMAQVKIHCQYHSCAWWVYRTISATFDLGLL